MLATVLNLAFTRNRVSPSGEAQRTLETLSDFDNTVTSSKLETESALSRVDEIEAILDRVDAVLKETRVKWSRTRVKKTVDRAVEQAAEAER